MSHEGIVWVEGVTLHVGAADAEGKVNKYPLHPVQVDAFWINATEVTNAQFAHFVEATGYVPMAGRAQDWE